MSTLNKLMIVIIAAAIIIIKKFDIHGARTLPFAAKHYLYIKLAFLY